MSTQKPAKKQHKVARQNVLVACHLFRLTKALARGGGSVAVDSRSRLSMTTLGSLVDMSVDDTPMSADLVLSMALTRLSNRRESLFGKGYARVRGTVYMLHVPFVTGNRSPNRNVQIGGRCGESVCTWKTTSNYRDVVCR